MALAFHEANIPKKLLISMSIMIIMKIIKDLVTVINLISQGGSRSSMVANIMTMFTKYENHSDTS